MCSITSSYHHRPLCTTVIQINRDVIFPYLMSSSDDESSYGGSYSSGSYESSDDEKETKEEEESEDSSEMMVIEIAFGKGKEDSIIVHWNDNPLDLAKVNQ